jgi:heme-degrading monooxygenase HmoA
MDARMVTLNALPGHVPAVAAFWDDAVIAQITAQAGSRGFFVLTDSANDRVVALSLWDSAADADATGPTFLSHMAAVAEHLAAPPSPTALHVAASTQATLSA